ncbi:2-polyprenyl-6-methoxyphenol hydroxylase [Sphingobium sp. YR768]|nr:2-polyprenyl-6-methoxyphenol hydroxylase [Sphingobium sp. YR768]
MKALIIGGGIGGLSAAIALSRAGHAVTVIERDPNWSVYGVGIIQQANVVRAMEQLDVLDAFLDAACGFDAVEIYIPSGDRVARVPSPTLVPGKPANVGIGRRALQKVLGESARALGAEIRLGLTVEALDDDGAGVDVRFSDGSADRHDIVVGADGVYSQTRQMILPDAEKPEFTGQGVWRYNFPRPAGLDALHVYNGPIGVGLVPMSAEQIYLFATSAEPGNPHYARADLAATMRAKLANTAPQIQALAAQISDNDGVVYRPLEAMMVPGRRDGSCCWAMPSMRPRRIWGRARAWRSRMRSCWPRNWARAKARKPPSLPIATAATNAVAILSNSRWPSATARSAKGRRSIITRPPQRCSRSSPNPSDNQG